MISGDLDFSEIKPIFSLLLTKYEKIFKQKPDFFDQTPTIASKIRLIPSKNTSNFGQISQNFDNFNKNTINSTMLTENKNNAVNYKNFSVAAFNAGNTVQSKHYNYPKQTSSILTVEQFNYVRYQNNNL